MNKTAVDRAREAYQKAEAKWKEAIEAHAIASAALIDATHEKRLAASHYARLRGLDA